MSRTLHSGEKICIVNKYNRGDCKVRRQNLRVDESGSMVTFIVVGLVLAALVLGGIYAVQQRKEKEPAKTPVAVKSSPSPSKTTSQKPQPHSSAPATTPKPSPSVSHAPAVKPAPVTPQTGTAPLPQTGPSDTFLSALMLATLTGVVIAYVRSSQLRFQLTRQVD